MKYDKKKALGIIVNAAKKYDEYLKLLNFIIIYQSGSTQNFVEVGFRDLNFYCFYQQVYKHQRIDKRGCEHNR